MTSVSKTNLNDPFRDALVRLNAEYENWENSSPRKGYQVIFEEKPQFKALLIPDCYARNEAALPGLPENEETYRLNECVFCQKTLKVHRTFQESLAVISQSQQVLVIPKKHYAHWFAAPIDEQVQILKEALNLRKQNPKAVRSHMALHCGAAAGQTVFHLHLRTGIYFPPQQAICDKLPFFRKKEA